MPERREVEVEIGARWGQRAVLLELPGAEPLRAPLPEPMVAMATPGRAALVYLDSQDRLDGWAVPEEHVGVRMHDGRAPEAAVPDTFDCKGTCGTVWYLVDGGRVSPSDSCLTCGGPVVGSQSDQHRT